ncbi:MAG: HlyD family secretion protein [Victivallales bacterium]|nr:HlyD family secretion protein [Victivallales bacterium]MCF7888572.1 HlyD family secretion protein [Victivallales bacterium]
MTKQKKIIIIFFSVLALVFIIYFSFHGWFIAYTDDAYLRGNIIIVSPRIDGHVQKVYVKNSQYVNKGDLLLSIDPRPFKLKLEVKKATLKQELTKLKIQQNNYKTALKKLKSIKQEFQIKQTQFERYKHLSKIGAVSKQKFEQRVSNFDIIKNKLSDAEQQCEYWQETINSQKAIINSAKSRASLAEYYLKQTKIYAPADGNVINCNMRPGDYVNQGTGLFSIVEKTEWWIKANYKESVLRKIKPEQVVYIFVRQYPFKLFRGTVKSIARGTSRTPDKTKVLPFIKPTTNWVRMQRRFSVIVEFSEKIPDDIQFCEGGNARTFIIL